MEPDQRLPPSSSALVALLSLTPPSPILSPACLPATLTSENIPILLFDNPLTSYDSALNFSSDLSYDADGGLSLQPDHSSSIGTFGRIHRNTSDPDIGFQRLATQRSATRNSTGYMHSVSSSTVLPLQPSATNISISLSMHEHLDQVHTVLPFAPPPALVNSMATDISIANHFFNPQIMSNSSSFGDRYSSELCPLEDDAQQSNLVQTSKCSLPQHPSWLDQVVVELLIDQEGFRAVKPSFAFMGYTSLNHMSNKDQDNDIAQFRPTTRQTFHFHRAPFDSPPILRRVMVNGEESRDHLSRQATLSLKSNGVYTVRGTELASLPTSWFNDVDSRSTKGTESQKLYWSFDYVVGDRRADSSGKTVEGEKTLTPLTFSCSPKLLQPKQGKRVRLIHIVKKSVATNLIAEKMQPPAFPHIRPLVPSLIPIAAPLVMTNMDSASFTKSSMTNLHRRVLPHIPQGNANDFGASVTRHTQVHDKSVSMPLASLETDSPNHHHVSALSVSRRRASSVGETVKIGSHAPSSRGFSPGRPSTFDCTVCPVRPIIPRSRLAELFDSDAQNILSLAAAHHEALTFQPLSPSPHHHQKR